MSESPPAALPVPPANNAMFSQALHQVQGPPQNDDADVKTLLLALYALVKELKTDIDGLKIGQDKLMKQGAWVQDVLVKEFDVMPLDH